MLKKERMKVMRQRVKKDYQLDVGEWCICPSARIGIRGDGNLPPKAPRNDEHIHGGFGEYWQRSKNVINSLEEIIIGSDWEKLGTMVNAISLVHFLQEQGLYILGFNFLPQAGDGEDWTWLLQIDIFDGEPRTYKHPQSLLPSEKKKIKNLVLLGLAQKGVKESDIEIIEERE